MHVWVSYFLWLLMFPPLFVLAQQSSQTGASVSEREKDRLRGPVKSVLVEQRFSSPDGRGLLTSTRTEYAPDGKTLEVRYNNSNGSVWTTTYVYQPNGNLVRTASGKAGAAPSSEAAYSYDEAGRLVEVKSGGRTQARIEYDAKGRKSVIEGYDSKPLPPNTAYAAHWEGSDLGFAPYPGGSLTTSYNEQDVATGAQLRDADGKLVARIERKFNEKGRVISEQQIADAPELMIPEEMKSKLSPEQVKSMGAFVAGGLNNRAISYVYDDHGRVTEQHKTGGAFGEEVIVTTYNDRGDKASEHTTTVMNPEVGRVYNLTESGAIIPKGQPQPAQPPSTYETQYTYQYDSYGNWTEQSTVTRSRPDAPWQPGFSIRRKLSYY